MSDKIWHSASIVVSQSQSAPAIRMYYVSVWIAQGEDFGRMSYPVLAIRTDFVQCFGKSTPKGQYTIPPYSANDMADNGWHFEGNEIKIHAVILDDDFGLIDSDDEMLGGYGHKGALVQCPWPFDQEKDDQAIASVQESIASQKTRELEKSESNSVHKPAPQA